jgi:mRNA-degrading endonuclease YafQ of YafQ-DinJ toxin-antitoxin module
MIKEIKRTAQFKKDYKKAIKNGCKEADFREVLL